MSSKKRIRTKPTKTEMEEYTFLTWFRSQFGARGTGEFTGATDNELRNAIFAGERAKAELDIRTSFDITLHVARTAWNMKDQNKASRSTQMAAAMLGKRGGSKGGVARAKKLSPERRKAIAQKAAKTRWHK